MPLPFKKLKNLAEMVNISDTDIMVAEDTDTTRKMTIRQLIMYIKNHAELNKHFATSENLNQANEQIEQLKNTDQNIQAEVSKNTKKLSGIEDGANNYSLPTASDTVKGGVTVGENLTINNGELSLTKDNITNALGFIPGTGDGGVEYVTGTETISGITKLYGKSGTNIDGALTQKAASEMFDSVNSELHTLTGTSISTSAGNINLLSKNGTVISSTKIPTTREVISITEPTDLSNDDYWTQAY